MWEMVRRLRASGVTIILTTHYIEEAEEMADRIGVISKGELILVEDKADADAEARQEAADAARCRSRMAAHARGAGGLARSRSRRDGTQLVYTFDAHDGARRHPGPAAKRSASSASRFKDLQTPPELARGHLRDLVMSRDRGEPRHEHPRLQPRGVWAIYRFEMARFARTLLQSIVAPVISTSLYFVVFGSAIGSRMTQRGRRELRRLHRARA